MLRSIVSRILPSPARRAIKRAIGAGGPDQAQILAELERRLGCDVPVFAREVCGAESEPPVSSRTDLYGARLKVFLASGVDPQAEELPLSAAFYKDLARFYGECDLVEGNLSQSMKRLAFTVVPYFHCAPGRHSSDVKGTLPLVGLLPSLSSNRRFVADALNGLAQVEEIYPERLVREAWSDHPHHYPVLRDLVAKSMKGVSREFLKVFSGPEKLQEMLIYQVQLELALVDLMRNKDWKLVIAGDAGLSLPLTLFDLPDAVRPPVAYFEHGLVYGDPFASCLARADHFLVHGTRDREIWQTLGISLERMISVGCLTLDHFPSREYSEHVRSIARLKHGLADSRKAILYGMDWQSDLIDRPSTAETQDLVIESLKILSEKHGVKPVLYLKYHPSPGDPFFQKSRVDYPLHRFLELESYGIEIRLASDLESHFPLSDCYFSHESTTLGDAIGATVPTLSLDYHARSGRPILDNVAYEAGSAHRYLSLRHSPDQIAEAFFQILSLDRSCVYDSCLRVFNNLYDCGRTTGLARFGRFFQETVLKTGS